MAITLRSTKGSALTHAEMDTNFSDLANEASGYTNAATLGTSPLSITEDTTYNTPIYIPYGFQFVVDAGINLHFAEGYASSDWNHCFDISAAGSSVTGDKAAGGYITPQHFGAKGDSATNDSPGFQAACNFASSSLFGHASIEVRVPVPSGDNYYLIGATVYVGRCIQLTGAAPLAGRFSGAIRLRPVDGLDAAMVFLGSVTSATNVSEFHPSNEAHNDEWKVYNGTSLFVCKLAHTADASNEPGVGASWETYWAEFDSPALIGDATLHADAWVTSTYYNISPGLGIGVEKMAAAGSIVRNINFEPITDYAVKFGVVHNCPMKFYDCSANYFGGAGFAARGQTGIGYTPFHLMFSDVGTSNSPDDFARLYTGSTCVEGNVNQSRYVNCRASRNVGHGFVCEGNNAGAVAYDNCDAALNFGAGFLDNSSVGSNFIFCHSAQNTWKVDHNDVRYMCIKGHDGATADSEPGVGSDWRRYWAVVNSDVPNATWSSGDFYVPCGGVNICNGTLGFATIFGHYSEGGIELGLVPRGRTQVFGGSTVAGTTGLGPAGSRIVMHPEFAGANVLHQNGMHLNSFGSVKKTDPALGTQTSTAIWIGGSYSTSGSPYDTTLLSFGDELDDGTTLPTGIMKFKWNNTVKAYSFYRDNVTTPALMFTGDNFNKGGYTQDGVTACPQGILLGQPDSANTNTYVRLAAVEAGDASAAATVLNGKAAVHGQRWYYANPSAGGGEGVVCTTAGTIGDTAVIKEFGAIDA